MLRRLPEQCEGSGAPGCAGLAWQEASPGQECCGWEALVQRRQCSAPLAPAHARKQHNIRTKLLWYTKLPSQQRYTLTSHPRLTVCRLKTRGYGTAAVVDSSCMKSSFEVKLDFLYLRSLVFKHWAARHTSGPRHVRCTVKNDPNLLHWSKKNNDKVTWHIDAATAPKWSIEY